MKEQVLNAASKAVSFDPKPAVSGDELKPGDYITVLRWTSHRDNSYRGDVFRVLVADGQHIRAKRLDGYFKGRAVTMDLGCLEVGRLSDEFVENVLAEER